MTPTAHHNAYQSTTILTASPGRLVMMLLDGAVRHLESANCAFKIDDPADRHTAIGSHLTRSVEIVRELRQCLNRTEGGELAVQLERLYSFLEDKIFEANIQKNAEILSHCTRLLSILRDSWKQMLHDQGASAISASLSRPDSSASLDVRT